MERKLDLFMIQFANLFILPCPDKIRWMGGDVSNVDHRLYCALQRTSIRKNSIWALYM